MKIAFLSPFYPYRGGIAQFSERLYDSLIKEHIVQVFSFSKLYPDFLFPGKTQYVDGPPTNDYPSKRILSSINPFSYQKTAKAIEVFQPDVLFIAYWMSFLGPAYGYIANKLKKKTKIIPLVHNAIPHEPKFFDQPFAKLLFKRSSGFVVMSDVVKNDILKMRSDAAFCLRPHPLYDHFGNQVEAKDARDKLGLDPDEKTLLFFGIIRDYKGLDLLIDAMSDLDDSYQLLIAGECYGSFEKYENQISQSSAKDRIHVINQYIPDSLVPVLFSAADLLVLPYKSATQSGVVPIAYHFTLPVLATDVGGLRETIDKPGTGLICQPDVKSISQGIQAIFLQGKATFVAQIEQEKKLLSWDMFAHEIITFANSL